MGSRKQFKESTLSSSVMSPKILLAKPSTANRPDTSSNFKIMRDEVLSKPKASINNLKLINENWEHCGDRIQQILSENSDFKVVGIIGPTGAGKSTILNELYGVNSTTQSPFPPFSVQTEEVKASARHCTNGIDMRITSERLILLDTQPIFSTSIVIDTMKPDGSSTHNSNLNLDQSLPADVAHQIMSIQLAIFLFSICHIVLITFEESECLSVCQFMKTAEMLKFELPDPSSPFFSKFKTSSVAAEAQEKKQMQRQSQSQRQSQNPKQGRQRARSSDENAVSDLKKSTDDLDDATSAVLEFEEYFPDVVFVNTKLNDNKCNVNYVRNMSKFLSTFFSNSPFSSLPFLAYHPSPSPLLFPSSPSPSPSPSPFQNGIEKMMDANKNNNENKKDDVIEGTGLMKKEEMKEEESVNFWTLPSMDVDDDFFSRTESYDVMISRLRDKIIGVKKKQFAHKISEKEWLKNSNFIFEKIKKSKLIKEYAQLLLASYSYRR